MINISHVDAAVRAIQRRGVGRPKIALVLGSGLGDFADSIEIESDIESVSIPHYPLSSVPGHSGHLIFGRLRNGTSSTEELLVFKGRVHFYESGSIDHVLFPLHVAKKLGVKVLVATNAAGGINAGFGAGDLMLIRDVLNVAFLRHRPDADERAPRRNRRPLLDGRLQAKVLEVALQAGVTIREGTYCWLKGPTYETAAEIQMLKKMGADAVGMSTVPELLAARDLKLRSVAISLISNLATGISPTKLSHEEVTETANRVKGAFTDLMKRFLLALD